LLCLNGMIFTPVNALTWTLGGISIGSFGLRGLRTYKQTGNEVAIIYAWLGATLSSSFFLFGVPALLTQNLTTLKYSSILADVMIQISMQVIVWLLWFIGLRAYVRLRRVLALTITTSIVLILVELSGTSRTVTISYMPHIVNYLDNTFVLVLQSIIYLSICLPVGYFFLLQIPRQPSAWLKIKSLLNAVIFISISLAATWNNLFDKGADTKNSAIFLAVIFMIFLVFSWLPTPLTDKARPQKRA